jgi:tRNA threonylcarbamoyladenosine biosynthesis protein TsaB
MNASDARIIILETSGRVGQVALARGGALLALRRLDEARRHARDLVPALRDLLHDQGWQPRDVQAVLVSRGPGSYTGLRVGIMSAKTFAYATGCALLAVDTFAAIAQQAPAEVRRLDVIADAQQDKVYVQAFVRSPEANAWAPLTELSSVKAHDWLAGREPDAWVSGPGLRMLAARLSGVPMVPSQDWEPRAESLLQIGWKRLLRGERHDLWSLEPLYLRPSSAEEKWQGRPGANQGSDRSKSEG